MLLAQMVKHSHAYSFSVMLDELFDKEYIQLAEKLSIKAIMGITASAIAISMRPNEMQNFLHMLTKQAKTIKTIKYISRCY
jgi:hypothetical protein